MQKPLSKCELSFSQNNIAFNRYTLNYNIYRNEIRLDIVTLLHFVHCTLQDPVKPKQFFFMLVES